MTQSVIQTSFATGEWAPKLRSRVDVAKYKSGAAYLRNFYVDFSGGGASTRQGTEYVDQCFQPGARLVGFQPSVNISYVLEFGQNYIRFYTNGAPVLEAAKAIQSITLGPPLVVNSTGHGYSNGQWVFISGSYYIVASATTNSYQLTTLAGTAVTALTGTQAQRVYTIASPFLASDLYPNQATGNPGIKWVQDVTSLIICHPSYTPQILTITSAASWTLTAITFGPTISAPTGTSIGFNIPGTNWFYSYIITAVDNNGQESAPSTPASGGNVGDIQTVSPSNLGVAWNTVAGAVSYNVYKASPSFSTNVAAGVQFGFVANVTGTSYQESYPGTAPDFSQTPPIIASPIVGGNVTSIRLTGNTNEGQVPAVTIAAAPIGGFTATAFASLGAVATGLVGGLEILAPAVGDNPTGVTLTMPGGLVAVVQAATLTGTRGWTVTQLGISNPGSVTGAGTPVPSGFGNGSITLTPGWSFVTANSWNPVWQINQLVLIQGGFGYLSPPAVSFTGGGASAVTTVSPINTTGSGVLGAAPVGNPRVPGFYQQRLGLYSPNAGLQSFYMSQPGSFFNFNLTNPSEDDNAIFGSIISEELNDIRSVLAVQTGVLALTGKGAWLINGGGGISTSSPITPSNVSATPQSFSGANDMRPLKVQLDALYVTNKGNYVRDARYDIYQNSYVGEDTTIISNHLFFGYTITDWCWAEEPFKTVWAVRSDGILLSLGFVKEQDLVGWAHHDTNGQFLSTCSVIETVPGGTVDAVYFIVQRLINGIYVQYVERMADRYFLYGYEDSWSVDCALQTTPALSPTSTLTITGNASVVGGSVTLTDATTSPFTSGQVGWAVRAGGGIYVIATFTSSSQVVATVKRAPTLINQYTNIATPTGYTIWQPVTTISGLTQLAGQTVTGVADGAVVPPTVVSASGTVTLGTAASKVTLGLSYLPQLQTLPLDLGEPTVQGKRKKIVAATIRVADTLGLQLGSTFANAVTMKDFQIGTIPTTSSGPVQVTDLVNPSNVIGAPFIDGRTIMDQDWQEAGSYCVQQNLPYPATVLAVMPEVVVGDTGK